MKFGPYQVDPLRNIFPNNPVQTAYLRFMKRPETPLKTMYEESVKAFEEATRLPDLIKTYYTELIKEGDDD